MLDLTPSRNREEILIRERALELAIEYCLTSDNKRHPLSYVHDFAEWLSLGVTPWDDRRETP